jgi:hypothetical protein
MSTDSTLAAAQGALVRALTGDGSDLPGFDGSRLDAVAEILVGKRRRAMASACPSLRRALGARFDTLFGEFAHSVPVPSGSTSADAYRFLLWLRDRRALPPGFRIVTIPIGRSRRGVIAWLGPARRILIGVGTRQGSRAPRPR